MKQFIASFDAISCAFLVVDLLVTRYRVRVRAWEVITSPTRQAMMVYRKVAEARRRRK
jgi:hypothetical protein